MEKEYMAEFLEGVNELLRHKIDQWIFSHISDPEFDTKQVIVNDFVNWLIAENKEDIIVPRRGGSYEDVRMERCHE